MPNKRIRDEWEPRVKGIAANDPKWGPRSILKELMRQWKDEDYPSERTIQRIKDDITPEERIDYSSFHWPESMLRRDLPWEASAAALELLANTDVVRQPRPPVRAVRWFWRVTLAAPHASFEVRAGTALVMASHEALGLPWPEGEEWLLAYTPWEADNWEMSYSEALSRDDNPIPRATSLEAIMGKTGALDTEDVRWAAEYWGERRRGLDELAARIDEMKANVARIKELQMKSAPVNFFTALTETTETEEANNG